jgi:hypothetical protein
MTQTDALPRINTLPKLNSYQTLVCQAAWSTPSDSVLHGMLVAFTLVIRCGVGVRRKKPHLGRTFAVARACGADWNP